MADYGRQHQMTSALCEGSPPAGDQPPGQPRASDPQSQSWCPPASTEGAGEAALQQGGSEVTEQDHPPRPQSGSQDQAQCYTQLSGQILI